MLRGFGEGERGARSDALWRAGATQEQSARRKELSTLLQQMRSVDPDSSPEAYRRVPTRRFPPAADHRAESRASFPPPNYAAKDGGLRASRKAQCQTQTDLRAGRLPAPESAPAPCRRWSPRVGREG